MSAAQELLVTAADLERLSAEGGRYELIQGELQELSPVGGDQGTASVNLSTEVTWYVRRHRLGRCFVAETGFLVSRAPDTVLAPDSAFIAAERLPADQALKGFVPIVPDIVLETRSPNDSRREVAEKLQSWLRHGVKRVWDLDPETRTLGVHAAGVPARTLRAEDVLTDEELLPGFSVRIEELF